MTFYWAAIKEKKESQEVKIKTVSHVASLKFEKYQGFYLLVESFQQTESRLVPAEHRLRSFHFESQSPHSAASINEAFLPSQKTQWPT